jgi:hypothetical protein
MFDDDTYIQKKIAEDSGMFIMDPFTNFNSREIEDEDTIIGKVDQTIPDEIKKELEN